jgi:hypothetical protein
MKTYQVELPDEFAPIVAELLGPGGWESFDDLVMNGLLRSLEELRFKEPEWMKEAVRLGAEQSERGETVDGPKAIERVRHQFLDARQQPA